MFRIILRAVGINLRSPHWSAVRRMHLHHEPVCQWCGGKEGLEVHHVVPFHIDRKKELDPANLITLCDEKLKKCHLTQGHVGDWKKFDLDIRKKCRKHKNIRSGSEA